MWIGANGNKINYNYYDSKKLTEAVRDFIVENIFKQLEFGIKRDTCFCLGTGHNFKFLSWLNAEHKLFGNIIPLEHPRYVMQYRSKQKQFYIDKYLEEFRKI